MSQPSDRRNKVVNLITQAIKNVQAVRDQLNILIDELAKMRNRVIQQDASGQRVGSELSRFKQIRQVVASAQQAVVAGTNFVDTNTTAAVTDLKPDQADFGVIPAAGHVFPVPQVIPAATLRKRGRPAGKGKKKPVGKVSLSPLALKILNSAVSASQIPATLGEAFARAWGPEWNTRDVTIGSTVLHLADEVDDPNGYIRPTLLNAAKLLFRLHKKPNCYNKQGTSVQFMSLFRAIDEENLWDDLEQRLNDWGVGVSK